MFEIRSEYNLEVAAQTVDFLVFQNSNLLDKEDCIFDTGYSFDLNTTCAEGDIITVFKLTNSYAVRRFFMRDNGYCYGDDLYNRQFYCDKSNNVIFLNGRLVDKDCYEILDDRIKFYSNNDFDPITGLVRKSINWGLNDLVTVLSPITQTGLKSLRFKGGQSILPGVDIDNKTFSPIRDQTVILVNGNIVQSKYLQFGGNSLKLGIETTEKDEIVALVFDKEFKFYEYQPKSGQHIFDKADINNSKLRYSSEDGACVLDINSPWDNFTGIRSGYYVIASSTIDGEEKVGVARIIDNEFTKSYVTAKIISDFAQTEYDASQWFMVPGDAKKIVSYLDPRTKATRAIPEVLESLQWYFLNDYHDGLERVQNSRSITRMDESFLGKTINYLGLFLDISDMNISNRRRALRELTKFYSRIGTQLSTNYLGLIEDSLMTLTDALWTNDYIHFYTKEELGGKSYRRELLDFTDYRFISSEATAFDDYGRLDRKERIQVYPTATGLLLEKGSYVIDSASKKWVSIPYELEINTITGNYNPGEYFVIIVNNKENYSIELVSSIPTNSFEDSEYSYSETLNEIVKKNENLDMISLPVGKVFLNGKSHYYTGFNSFSHTDNKVFAFPESSFSFWDNENNLITPKFLTLQSSQSVTVNSGEYYLVYSYSLNSERNGINPVLNLVRKELIHNIGVKPDPSFKTKLIVGDTKYVYNRFSKLPEEQYDENGNAVVDKFGFLQLKYDRKNLWKELTDLGSGEVFPDDAVIYNSFSIGEKDYVCTGKDALPELEYVYEKLRYVPKSEPSGKEWVKTERVLSANSPELMPFLDDECYFNLHDFKWYKFSNDSWHVSNMAVVGEVSIVNDEIVRLIPYTNSADYDNRENYPTYLEYKYNTPYKRQYSLERNIVSNSVSAYKVNDVAYDWGLITESPILGWVLYTEFTPPKGYYPTNHVLFNYTANNIEDTQEMLTKAKYKFYEICPTPWVLQDIANVLLFESGTEWVGSTMFGVLDQYFKQYDRYVNVKFDIEPGYMLNVINNSDNYVYLYQNDGSCGEIKDCKHIIVRETVGTNEIITYTKERNSQDLVRVDAQRFDAISRDQYVENYRLDHIETKVGTDLILVLQNDEFTATYKYTVKNSERDEHQQEVDQVVHLGKLFNNYAFGIRVITENDNPSDKIKVTINSIEKDVINFFMTDDQEVTFQIKIEQNGCKTVEYTVTYTKDDFDENRNRIDEIPLEKIWYNVNFTSNLSDNFELFIRQADYGTFSKDAPYKLASKNINVPYNTTIYFKYANEFYNDYEESILIKESKLISRSLSKKKYTFAISVTPSNVQPTINGLNRSMISAEAGDRIFWSAGDYQYKEQFGEFTIIENKNLSISLQMRNEYIAEDVEREKVVMSEKLVLNSSQGIFLPNTLTSLTIRLIGAGGSGSGGHHLTGKWNTYYYSAYGGGSGASLVHTFSTADINRLKNQFIYITVGVGGSSVASHHDGITGGDTIFDSFIAKGGTGGRGRVGDGTPGQGGEPTSPGSERGHNANNSSGGAGFTINGIGTFGTGGTGGYGVNPSSPGSNGVCVVEYSYTKEI